jgi:hypothetical protein
VVAAVAAPIDPHPVPGRLSELAKHLRRDGMMGRAFEHGLRPLGIGLGLIPSRVEADNAILQRRIVQIGHTRVNSIISRFKRSSASTARLFSSAICSRCRSA